MISVVSIAGGVLLIIAALLMFKGNIYKASVFYLLADISWMFLALTASNYIGFLFVMVGLFLNIGVFLKMHKKEFVKNLNVK